MSDFRTPVSMINDAPQDAKDGLTIGTAHARPVVAAADYAQDTAMVLLAQTEVWPLVEQCRRDRVPIESKWQAIRRMDLRIHDENQRYNGRSNAYLPVHAKNIAAQNTSLVRGLFPTNDYIDAQAEMDDPQAGVVAKHYMQYQFEQKARLRIHMKLFGRQLLNYGWSVLKGWYRKPQQYAKAKSKKMTFTNAAGLVESAYGPEFQESGRDEGLTVSARSIFNFYAYPFTAETLRETLLQFEDVHMSMLELIHLAKLGGWFNMEKLSNARRPSDLSLNANAEYTDRDTSPNDQGTGAKLGDRVVLTECYTFMELPSSEYSEYDAKGCPLPVRILFVGDVPVSIRRNPNYHQSSPFLALSLNASPGWMLGVGPGEMIAPLQYLANDFINQTNDVCIYGLNPIWKVVPGMIVGGLRPVTPGVVWHMNSLDAVDAIHPPTDQLQWGVQMSNMMISMGQDFGGAPPAMQGTGASGNAKTATGAQILQHNAQQPLQDLTEDMEAEILVPLAEMAYSLGEQHAPAEQQATVFNKTMAVRKEDLSKPMAFRWLASSQAANAQMRAMQATQFLSALQPWAPVLAQQGVQLNVLPIMERIWTEALGYRGWDKILQPPTPNMPPPMMGGMPGQPPGAPGGMPPEAPQQDPMSTVAQSNAGGAGLEVQPGEGTAHSEVRDNSNITSALLGALGG